jgi:hypothetical protein
MTKFNQQLKLMFIEVDLKQVHKYGLNSFNKQFWIIESVGDNEWFNRIFIKEYFLLVIIH